MEYWESKFSTEGAMWQFEPSDSAAIALELFKTNGISKILIPGFGYGRNAKLFFDAGFEVTGIEISATAIDLAKSHGLNGTIHHGSVTDMPFGAQKYGGIFCYALLHLLNKPQRKKFIRDCFNQLESGGFLIFTVASRQMSYYGNGKLLSRDRFKIMNGLNVYFYDILALQKELAGFGTVEIREIAEPIKFMSGQEPLKLLLAICKKS
jgi:SAM-dependent methyltransferase